YALAVRRVMNLGMELNRVNIALGILDGGHRIFRSPDLMETVRKAHNRIAVAVPNWQGRRQGPQKPRPVGDLKAGAAVFALARRLDFSSQLLRDQLQSVANPEHGRSQVENAPVGMRSTVIENRARPAG